jgi:hypothetical protein
MSEQAGDTRIELMFRLEAALKRIETLEEDIAASEHNFMTMRQSRNEAADRIEALEAALRQIANPSTVAGMHEQDRDRKLQEIARAALGPEQDK